MTKSSPTPYALTEADWDSPVSGRQKAYLGIKLSEQAHERFLKADLPLSVAAGIGTLFAFQQNDAQSLMTRAFQRLVKNRTEALDVLKFLKDNGINHRQGRFLIDPSSAGLLAPMNLAFQVAESPKGLMELHRKLLTQNPSNLYVARLGRSLSEYARAYRMIVSHPTQLQAMMIPMLTRLMQLSPFQAKVLATSNPQAVLSRLFGNSLSQTQLTPSFFNKVFTTLSSASRLRMYLFAGSVAGIMLGVFLTRMEMQMKDH